MSASYDVQDRLVSFGSKSYTFTAAGELASVTDAATGQTASFAYDGLGGLRQVVREDGTVIDYGIDGEGHRVWKKKNGVVVQGFLWSDALRVVAELDGAGNVVQERLHGGAGLF